MTGISVQNDNDNKLRMTGDKILIKIKRRIDVGERQKMFHVKHFVIIRLGALIILSFMIQ